MTACSATFDPDTIASRLRELAFLNNAATIRYKATKPVSKGKASAAKTNGSKAPSSSDEDSSSSDGDNESEGVVGDPKEGWQVFHYSEGLKEYVKWLNSDKQAFHEPIVISREVMRTLTPGHAYCMKAAVLLRPATTSAVPSSNAKSVITCML